MTLEQIYIITIYNNNWALHIYNYILDNVPYLYTDIIIRLLQLALYMQAVDDLPINQ